MSEIMTVAKAMAEAAGFCWENCAQSQWERDAEAGIRALDAYRAAEKRKNCKHPRKTGTGMVGSDGSSYHDWHCPDCGAGDRWETPARNTGTPLMLSNGDR